MFLGHFGAGLAAKKFDSRPSLGTLILAAQFIDLIWPVLLLLGIEKVAIEPGNTAFTPLNFIYYPFTHSLMGVIIWALLFGAIYFALKKNARTAVLLGVLVISHWILDLITHIPDLPLSPFTQTRAGFGLWNSVALTILVEGSIFIAGAWLYMSFTRPLNKKGKYSLAGMLAFLLLIYVMNIFSAPPPSEQAIGMAGLLQWLFIPWGYWIDRNRILVKENGNIPEAAR